jgi:hypothetical protein
VAESNYMDKEVGNLGLVGCRNVRFAIDHWTIDHAAREARAYCDLDNFVSAFNFKLFDRRSLIGDSWLIRFDNETNIYYGSTKCTGIAFPSLKDKLPGPETFQNTLVLYFSFHHASYGPYHIAAAKAMARNGNEMFMDMLSGHEIADRTTRNDRRFMPFLSHKHSMS